MPPSYKFILLNIHTYVCVCFYYQVISQLKVLMRADTIADKFDREQWTNELSPILSLWKKLNQVRNTYITLLTNTQIAC